MTSKTFKADGAALGGTDSNDVEIKVTSNADGSYDIELKQSNSRTASFKVNPKQGLSTIQMNADKKTLELVKESGAKVTYDLSSISWTDVIADLQTEAEVKSLAKTEADGVLTKFKQGNIADGGTDEGYTKTISDINTKIDGLATGGGEILGQFDNEQAIRDHYAADVNLTLLGGMRFVIPTEAADPNDAARVVTIRQVFEYDLDTDSFVYIFDLDGAHTHDDLYPKISDVFKPVGAGNENGKTRFKFEDDFLTSDVASIDQQISDLQAKAKADGVDSTVLRSLTLMKDAFAIMRNGSNPLQEFAGTSNSIIPTISGSVAHAIHKRQSAPLDAIGFLEIQYDEKSHVKLRLGPNAKVDEMSLLVMYETQGSTNVRRRTIKKTWTGDYFEPKGDNAGYNEIQKIMIADPRTYDLTAEFIRNTPVYTIDVMKVFSTSMHFVSTCVWPRACFTVPAESPIDLEKLKARNYMLNINDDGTTGRIV